ncbi:hypothetical protein AB0E10_05625 [Streptomyces sp. NPDC048045]|uniref:hypothetical protein n=1 Tax=Streptomyces sp. NPDC048045 TaxID=3154710 RepID=UPI00341E94BE
MASFEVNVFAPCSVLVVEKGAVALTCDVRSDRLHRCVEVEREVIDPVIAYEQFLFVPLPDAVNSCKPVGPQPVGHRGGTVCGSRSPVLRSLTNKGVS